METRPPQPIAINDDPKVYNTFFHKKENEQKAFAHLQELFKTQTREDKSIEGQLEALGQLPDYLLIFLLVEIEKIRKEKGCFKYEEREPGCIKAFFESMKTVFELGMDTPNELLASHEVFKALQKIITDVSKVNMKTINTETSGEYRKNLYEIIELPVYSMDGIAELIKMIKEDQLPQMMICPGEIYQVKKNFYNSYILYGNYSKLLAGLNDLNTYSAEKMLESIATIFQESVAKKDIDDAFNKLNLKFLFGLKINEASQKTEDTEALDLLKKFKQIVVKGNFYSIFKFLKENSAQDIIQGLMASLERDFSKEAQESEQKFFSVDENLISNKNFKNISQRYQTNDPKKIAETFYQELFNCKDSLVIQFPPGDFIEILMEKNIKSFKDGFKEALQQNEDERFTFLYKHLKVFLLIHPFLDANNRLFVNALLPLWHMQLRLPEVPMFYNPFVFYSYSIPEITATAKLACANTMAAKEYQQKGKSPLFAFGHKTLSSEQIKAMETFIAPFREVIAQASVRLIVKQMTTAFDSYVKSTQTQLQMFAPSHPDQEVLTKDLPQMKSCKNVKELITLLGTKAKEHQEKNPTLAEFYGKVIENFQPKPTSTMTP